MDIRAGRHPNSLKPFLLDHLIKRGKDFDVAVFEELASPLEFSLIVRADGDEIGVRDAIHQGLCMAFAHSTQADDCNVEFGRGSLRRHVVQGVHCGKGVTDFSDCREERY